MCSFTTTRSACPKASRALSLVRSKNASSDFAASLSSPSKTSRKACSALSLVCSRNASSEPTSASSLPSCPWRLSANAFNSSASFPERAPLAEAAQFHLLYCVPLRLQHDLLPNIGLLAIQQSVLQLLHALSLGQSLQQHHHQANRAASHLFHDRSDVGREVPQQPPTKFRSPSLA